MRVLFPHFFIVKDYERWETDPGLYAIDMKLTELPENRVTLPHKMYVAYGRNARDSTFAIFSFLLLLLLFEGVKQYLDLRNVFHPVNNYSISLNKNKRFNSYNSFNFI